MDENPYQSPTVAAALTPDETSPEELADFLSLAKDTWIRWEKLRIVYLAILTMVTVLLGGAELTRPRVIVVVIEGAIVANLCYFAGPILETFVRWFGYKGKALRVIVFTLGTVFASLLAVATIAIYALPAPF